MILTPVQEPAGNEESLLSPILTPSVQFEEPKLEQFQEQQSALGGGAIAGITIGVVVGIAIGLLLLSRRNSHRKEGVAWSSELEVSASNLQEGRRYS
jgi:hypothetical protein